MRTAHGLRIRDLCKAFPAGSNGSVDALVDVAIDIPAGEFTVVVGPNGSGKSTLLNVLAGDVHPDRGTIQLLAGDKSIGWLKLGRRERATYLSRVHQDPRRGTAAGMTVRENVRLVRSRRTIPSPFRFRAPNHDRNWFINRLQNIGLAEKIDSRVSELSQGQRQLLALELAMLRAPAFLLLDEHTASLDQANAKKCLDVTTELSRKHETTVIMVTHNLMDALTYGDRLIVMRDGRIHRALAGEEKRSLTLDRLLDLCGYVI